MTTGLELEGGSLPGSSALVEGCVAIILPNFVARYLETCDVVDDPGGSAYGRSGRAAMPLAVSSLRDGTLVDNGPTAGDASGGVAGASCEGCESFSIVLVPLVLSEGARQSYNPISSARARTPGFKPSRKLMARAGEITGLANFSKQSLETLKHERNKKHVNNMDVCAHARTGQEEDDIHPYMYITA